VAVESRKRQEVAIVLNTLNAWYQPHGNHILPLSTPIDKFLSSKLYTCLFSLTSCEISQDSELSDSSSSSVHSPTSASAITCSPSFDNLSCELSSCNLSRLAADHYLGISSSNRFTLQQWPCRSAPACANRIPKL